VCVCACVRACACVCVCASMCVEIEQEHDLGEGGVVNSNRPSKSLVPASLFVVHFSSLFFLLLFLFVIHHDIYRFYCMVIKLAVDFHQTL